MEQAMKMKTRLFWLLMAAVAVIGTTMLLQAMNDDVRAGAPGRSEGPPATASAPATVPTDQPVDRPAGSAGSGVATHTEGESWTSPDGITVAVNWSLEEASVKVTTEITNNSTVVIDYVFTEVTVDGTQPYYVAMAEQLQIGDVLPGQSGTLTESYSPGSEIQVKVWWNHMNSHGYWVGSI